MNKLERDQNGRFVRLQNVPEPVPTPEPEIVEPNQIDSFTKELINETAPLVPASPPPKPDASALPEAQPEPPKPTTPTKQKDGSSGFGSILAGVALALTAGAAALVLGKRPAPSAAPQIVNAPVQAPSAGKRFL
jgi:hypothetical protein